jgi:uncharacterized protein
MGLCPGLRAVYGARRIPPSLRMANIETPCNRTCVLHPASRLCVGCGRSLDEIACWIELSDRERAQIMAQLPARLAAMTAMASGATSAETMG